MGRFQSKIIRLNNDRFKHSSSSRQPAKAPDHSALYHSDNLEVKPRDIRWNVEQLNLDSLSHSELVELRDRLEADRLARKLHVSDYYEITFKLSHVPWENLLNLHKLISFNNRDAFYSFLSGSTHQLPPTHWRN